MSSWIVVTLRGRASKNYAFSRQDNFDPWDAVADIYATAEADSRIRAVTAGNDCVYVRLLNKSVDAAEEILSDYAPMLRDAVVLDANNTTDTGVARYYPGPGREDAYCSDRYAETQSEDGTHVGRLACAVISARHGIIARDPFHEEIGRFDEDYADGGQDLTTLDEVYDA